MCRLLFLRWIPSVSGIYTRFPCSANKNACPRGFRRLDGKSCLPRLLGSRMCHKSHAIQLSARSVFRLRLAFLLYLSTQKDLSCPAISQAKEVSYSLYIQFRCTQKLPFYLNRKGWLVGWLVARIVPIIYIFITIYHACVHFLSKFYTPILPQSEVIVKRKIFRGFGRIFRCAWFLLSFVEFCRNPSEFSLV